MPRRTIFRYRERVYHPYVLLFRIGFLEAALAILEDHPRPTPDDEALREDLLCWGARLRHRGEHVDKQEHERAALAAEAHRHKHPPTP